jgi:DNA-directed RNA polymerase subunit H (RpoH/RPB5)
MEINTIIHNLKEMLVERGEDIKEFEEKEITIPREKFYNELDYLEFYTDKSAIIFAFKGVRKNIIAELKDNEENMDDFIKNHGNKINIILIFNNDIITTPNITLLTKYDKIMQKRKGMLQYFQIKHLLFNPTKHEIVPKHRKLTPEETAIIMEKYLIKSKLQVPIIMHSDVIAKWLGLKQGEFVEITRYNENSGVSYYYRCCV